MAAAPLALANLAPRRGLANGDHFIAGILEEEVLQAVAGMAELGLVPLHLLDIVGFAEDAERQPLEQSARRARVRWTV